ncbi:DnaB helicase C-terminal domain-containing protein [Candidatus Mycoplasma haematominutum]|uniref:DNA 5'-3' helicase n=1 Tax=Candidatus Mycoplasma haematominutum 'Birmingham 1' TaxID=1116213 RepID=G8C2I8_9MOLU|nr:DnaB helicase C-terminal domain-containing protein [Candidatus Mycoplasma haematominutum]CCE66536.1 replicative DNA helicase [Candidatus Mycoplasma haematominutum 'Birmingham 1']
MKEEYPPESQERVVSDILWAEKAVLASYIYNYPEVINFSEIEAISPAFFQNQYAREIFKTLSTLEVQDGKFDRVLIYEALKQNPNVDSQFLEDCDKFLENLPRGTHYYNFRKYLEILRNNWIKKELNNLSREILQTRWNLENMNDLIAKWERSFLDITLKDRKLNYLSAGEVVKSYNELVELNQKEKNNYFLKTGFHPLDLKIKGFKPGQFLVIASRPGIGKTTFALNLVNNNLSKITPPFQSEKEHAIGIFSLEMVKEIIMEKLLAIDSKTELFTLQREMEGKRIEQQDREVIESSKRKIAQAKLLFCDDANITLGKIIATIKLWSRKYLLKLVIIDYLQLINLPLEREFNNINANQKISLISRQLKVLSIDLNICILSLSQLNRKLEERKGADKVPMLSDLRDSGSIEQDADIVIFLYPTKSKKIKPEELVESVNESEFEKEDDSHEISLKIGKNRYGPTGVIRFNHNREYGKFSLSR